MTGKPTSRLQILQTSKDDPTCVTFILPEDHTLGNALRYIIMKYSDVQFCGYTIPHPLEGKIHFRIQTFGTPAQDILKRGLTDLKECCSHVMETFEHSVAESKGRTGSNNVKMET